MGKAIIFDGTFVSSPLRTVTFEPDTASEYVSNYQKYVTITTEQATALTVFIDSMMTANLWGNVVNFTPLLGGLSGYKYNAKSPKSTPEWSLPTAYINASGETVDYTSSLWDDEKSAPKLNVGGNQTSTPMVVDGFSSTDCCLMVGCIPTVSGSSRAAFTSHNKTDLGCINYHYYLTQGGYQAMYDACMTTKPTSSTSGYNSKTLENLLCNFVENFTADGLSIYADIDNTFIDGYDCELSATYKSNTKLGFNQANYFANADAPCNNTLAGYYTHVIMFNRSLTESEIQSVNSALRTLNIALGRYAG